MKSGIHQGALPLDIRLEKLRPRLRSRQELARKCEPKHAVISVHEHVGTEILEYPNGVDVRYHQTQAMLAKRMSSVAFERLGVHSSLIGSACIPMPYYVRFKRSRDTANGIAEIYGRRNLEMLRACAEWSGKGPRTTARAFWPLPVLITTAQQSAVSFKKIYYPVLDKVVALKWHPAAEQAAPVDFINAGHLDLAAELNLPIVVHCARIGSPGDLDDVLLNLLPAASRLGVRIDVAHAGFLHPRIFEVKNYPNIYTDCCPWGAICSSAERPLDETESIERLASVLAGIPDRIAFGFDTPWHVQRWDDGRRHGKSIAHEVHLLARSLALSKVGPWPILHDNGARFLFGDASTDAGGSSSAQQSV